VKRKTTALVPISLLLITCIIIPVSAFYFDFQYFETDKLVYEVGETIDMVAKLIADFSGGGWCYVSFAVVTDLGPSFADEYFIPPSPAVRYLNSSYTILPEHTSPNTTGDNNQQRTSHYNSIILSFSSIWIEHFTFTKDCQHT
jgi:hypothetical protein